VLHPTLRTLRPTLRVLRYGPRDATVTPRSTDGAVQMDVALVTGRDAAAERLVGTFDPESDVDVLLRDALAARDVDVHRPRWNDTEVDWASFDLAVVRTTYDYVDDRDGFVAWAARAADQVALHNPADVLRWNTHKSYLIELEERGAPVVPTAWLAAGDRIDLAGLLRSRGWQEAVLKPAVGAGSEGIVRVTTGTAAPAGQDELEQLLAVGDVMVQPFRHRIAHGELSLVAIEGRVVHAVRKRPVAGEYRVQGRFGGAYAAEVATSPAVALGEWILGALGTPLLFARIDLVEADDGTLELSEVEATEPDLYLAQSPASAGILADAIVRHAAAARTRATHG